jgi:phosphoribosyl-AMP cyclohydrolase
MNGKIFFIMSEHVSLLINVRTCLLRINHYIITNSLRDLGALSCPATDSGRIEERRKKMLPELKYDSNGLIPAIIQDHKTGEVLMMAYMNERALEMTVESGFTHFWSRSRQKYWKKGETSGHLQEVREILMDCDADTLLIKVIQRGPGACHTGHRNIRGEEISEKTFSEEEVYGKSDS